MITPTADPSAGEPSGAAPGPGERPIVEPSADDLAPGLEVEVDVGPVAHGGHCVARYDGRVIFVRLALPGERVIVKITEARRGSFCRGEAVWVLRADPRRVEAPCGHFRPDGCGGCDFQHAQADLQRELKGFVVAEQLQRLAGVERAVTVEPLPGDGFGWRTRVRWALDAGGRIGPRRVRSHRVEAVNAAGPCLIAAPGLTELAGSIDIPTGVRRAVRPAATAQPDGRTPRARRSRSTAGGLPEVTLTAAGDGTLTAVWAGADAPVVTEHAAGRDFSVAADGFWQVHAAAAQTLSQAVADALEGIELAGGTGWDLYGGVGLFAEILCRAVGTAGSVIMVETDPAACELAVTNLTRHPQAAVRQGRVDEVIGEIDSSVDAVVLDPPRSGAGPSMCAAIAARAPAVIVYVACDPAALGRDTAALAGSGYRLDTLRAFDAFPQTHHVECVARFLPA